MNIVAALIIMISVYAVAGIDRTELPAEYFVSAVETESPAYEAGMEDGDMFYMLEGVLVEGNYDVISSGLQNGDGINITIA